MRLRLSFIDEFLPVFETNLLDDIHLLHQRFKLLYFILNFELVLCDNIFILSVQSFDTIFLKNNSVCGVLWREGCDMVLCHVQVHNGDFIRVLEVVIELLRRVRISIVV